MSTLNMVLERRTGRRRPARLSECLWSSIRLPWEGFLIAEHVSGAVESTDICHLAPMVILQAEGIFRAEVQIEGRWRRVECRPGQLNLFPRHYPYSIRSRATGGFIALSLEPRFLAGATLGLSDSEARLKPVFASDDPLARELLLALSAEAKRADSSDALYAETLATMMAAHLVRHYSGAERPASSPNGHLDKERLRRVLEYMHEHLSERVTLEHLGALAGLSPWHFARQFKSTTGRPPHEYLIELRTRRCRELLLDKSYSLAQIALEGGFSDQSHLARHFKRRYGKTPAAYARLARG